MVSARVDGYCKFYVLKSNGGTVFIMGASTDYLGPIGVGWKSEGVAETIVDVTKWNKLAITGTGAKVDNGSSILMTIYLPATKTLDSTDAHWVIPVTVIHPDGSREVRITDKDDWNAGDVNTTYQNLVIPATVETPCGKLTGNTGETLYLGGGPIWFGFQDNA